MNEAQIQESEYDFPYHHIPVWNDDFFSQVRHWSWGMHYAGGLEVAMALVLSEPFQSLLDIGCGDGRFLLELKKRVPEARLKGVDFSARALGFARAFAPGIDFESVDVTKSRVEGTWDVATLVEVCEHIPPADLEGFISCVAAMLEPMGRIVITVPHLNKKLSPKHHQHFSETMLRDLLDPFFEDLSFKYFDKRSLFFRGITMLLGGKGRHFIVNSPALNRLLFKLYKNWYLDARTEANCMRIACCGRRKLR